MSNRPTFINIGPGRCGTSWLFEALSAHPAIAMAAVKETEYFNTHYAKGQAWYETHFPQHRQAIGEISNNYYLDPQVAARIRAYDPDMKLIVNLRQPYGLLWSFYQFGLRRGLQLGGLERALAEPIGRLMGSGYEQRRRDGATTVADEVTLLDSVLLHERLQPFFAAFPRRNIFVLVYERIGVEPDVLLGELYRFLGVDADFRPAAAATVVNAAIEPRSKALARLATQASYALRSAGAYRLLGRLHRSALIKRLLFRTPEAAHATAEVRAMLGEAARTAIEADVRRLMDLHAPLAHWWLDAPSRPVPERALA